VVAKPVVVKVPAKPIQAAQTTQLVQDRMQASIKATALVQAKADAQQRAAIKAKIEVIDLKRQLAAALAQKKSKNKHLSKGWKVSANAIIKDGIAYT
jgi:hypothetical protein